MGTELDHLVLRVAKGDESSLGMLSRSKSLYVVLAANRPDLLAAVNDTIV